MSGAPLNSRLHEARSAAAGYEASLEPTRRKRLGQFFTGLSLGRLLAAIALDPEAATVIDPMAGHGDLLDAAVERATRRGQTLTRVDGVEIDSGAAGVCRQRLRAWEVAIPSSTVNIRAGDAFDVAVGRNYCERGYDLVITNPPYVRYQSVASIEADEFLRTPDEIRRNLSRIVQSRVGAEEWPIWRTLIESYSGLADLSVPAWLLSAALVRPGGVLALVAPATWRSRNYGDVIQYLLARYFRLEYLVEDTQPGWFSDALVRTQLVIARRRAPIHSRVPLLERSVDDSSVISVRVSPPASTAESLVGTAFQGEDSEDLFAGWLHSVAKPGEDGGHGLAWQVDEVAALSETSLAHLRRRRWFHALESRASEPSSLFQSGDAPANGIVPTPVKRLLDGVPHLSVVVPKDAGLAISQGLRTGCNAFFYVDWLEDRPGDVARVRVSKAFGGKEMIVPAAVLRPVVRRQSEVADATNGRPVIGRVLDLNEWVLPEDAAIVERARQAYVRQGMPVPRMMPDALASFVRVAGDTVYGRGDRARTVRELSAVRTNTRLTDSGRPPHFWYMLPPFGKRHQPDAFVPRINQGIPDVEVNCDPRVLIDANFSTIWGESEGWTPVAIRSLLSTTWCRACMEAIGTRFGGGALKLEATHLTRLPIPVLEIGELALLDSDGQAATGGLVSETVERLVIGRVTGLDPASIATTELIKGLTVLAETMCANRQRRAT